jgi:hypothetical protein
MQSHLTYPRPGSRGERAALLSVARFRVHIRLLLTAGIALFNAAILVYALNLYHTVAVHVPRNRPLAMAHGGLIVSLEQRLHLGLEPLVQRQLSQGLHTPFGLLPGAALHQALVWLYLNAMPAWLFAALVWAYLYRPRQFARLRDVTIVSALLAGACYWLFPAAPPRMVLRASPAHLQDWVYGGTGVNIGVLHTGDFNPFAAFPSVHLLWALIPALCLAGNSRRVWVWLLALCLPGLMALTILGTGNHYVIDCLGSCALLALSAALVGAGDALGLHLRRRQLRIGFEIPAGLGLCLACAGLLVSAGGSDRLRDLMALGIVVLVGLVMARDTSLWRERRTAEEEPRVYPLDYLAGVLFIVGSTAAAQMPGLSSAQAIDACALLWLTACICTLSRHLLRQRAEQSEAPLAMLRVVRGDALARSVGTPLEVPASAQRQVA